ncbi:hypothetical protein [Nocardioides sp. zg-DK7169]|uniref:hypothetical protein n=1 Tax=Nocardioides sp. zg-DK7169 TaxID=2736600 RepID=UPI0015533A25|nr:hypothetical protein [Nocardioides sp. zg-DK7169]NPC95613.1 hypothetical protein [Nocardioides sp. zg-DK7169]
MGAPYGARVVSVAPQGGVGVLALAREWGDLPAPGLADLRAEVSGDLRASFARPLTRVAPLGLGLVGLPRWQGKRFRDDGADGDGIAGANVVRRRDGATEEVLAMRASIGASFADGRPAVVVAYAADARRPWRWVRDELRLRPDGTLLGMTWVDAPVLRRAPGTPFLLTPSR